ncbi:MAG TPA: periplasmic heavy metal sensor [Bryobacteraceae bacterium]|jgi:Spy/CpxP family protein refolding chaperone|nr:periplasmic heavy metal sensor [Bryobacteraceae bacterium]
MRRYVILAILLSGSLCAQMPKSLYAWWSKPVIAKQLNLTNVQRQQIRATVLQYRPHLIDVRAEVNKAEIDLQAQFDHDPVDQAKANQAIERLIAARTDLTRTLSQMSLKLRTVLTEQQWRDLERLRPGQAEEVPATETPTAR